jgi:hypothetical protein
MDSSVSPKDETWFLRVCHHISNAVYNRFKACPLTLRLAQATSAKFGLYAGSTKLTHKTSNEQAHDNSMYNFTEYFSIHVQYRYKDNSKKK